MSETPPQFCVACNEAAELELGHVATVTCYGQKYAISLWLCAACRSPTDEKRRKGKQEVTKLAVKGLIEGLMEGVAAGLLEQLEENIH